MISQKAVGWVVLTRLASDLVSQVLHIDRNNYYGGQSASLNLNQVRKATLQGLCVCCHGRAGVQLVRRWIINREGSVVGADLLRPFCVSFAQLYERFRPGQKPPAELGPSRDYNVDLVPKFIMVRGSLCVMV